jgi:hypothetical protein
MQTKDFIPPNIKKLGLMVSGGLDSALLLYLITKEIKDNQLDVELMTYTVDKPSVNSTIHSKNIIAIIEKLNDIKINNAIVGNKEAHSDYEIVFGVIDALNRERKTNMPLDILYLATTAVPEKLANEPGAPARSRNSNFAVVQPWGAETKDNVIKLVVENKLFTLIENSHSCTDRLDYHCGECWMCKERKWALAENNVQDFSDIRKTD